LTFIVFFDIFIKNTLIGGNLQKREVVRLDSLSLSKCPHEECKGKYLLRDIVDDATIANHKRIYCPHCGKKVGTL